LSSSSLEGGGDDGEVDVQGLVQRDQEGFLGAAVADVRRHLLAESLPQEVHGRVHVVAGEPDVLMDPADALPPHEKGVVVGGAEEILFGCLPAVVLRLARVPRSYNGRKANFPFLLSDQGNGNLDDLFV